MKIYYLIDQTQWQCCNLAGKDYTPAYIPALAAFMGVTVTPVTKEQLDMLGTEDILLVGAQRLAQIPNCRVILMGTEREQEPCGAVRCKKIFAHYLTKEGKRLPLFVPVKQNQIQGEVLAYAQLADGTRIPALVQGEKCYEFCFDLPATVWFSGDGFEPTEPSDYFFIGRTPDFRPLLEGESSAEPFSDLLIGELEKILKNLGVPMLYRLPPDEEGNVPDLVLHFSGDDDCTSADYNLQAALRMESYGFLYHINAMPMAGQYFVFDKDAYENMQAHGCELALHLDFTGGVSYSAESIQAQSQLYEACFGIRPYTNTNHCLIQGGSTAERMRWLAEAGIAADNGKLGEFDPADINAFDLCGFGYGTSFPRYTCDDCQHGNVLLSTMEIPITYYEPRLYEEDSDTSRITDYLDNGAAWGRITQFFIHPHYLHDTSEDLEATKRVLELIGSHCERMGYRKLISTTDRIAAFWQGRKQASIQRENSEIVVDSQIPVVLVLPAGYLQKEAVCVDGKPAAVISRKIGGEQMHLVALEAGTHRIHP